MWQIKDFKFNEIVSVAGKGVTEAFFGCVAAKGLTCKTEKKREECSTPDLERFAQKERSFTALRISHLRGCSNCQRAKRERSSRSASKSTERVMDCGGAVYWTRGQMADRLGGEFRVRG